MNFYFVSIVSALALMSPLPSSAADLVTKDVLVRCLAPEGPQVWYSECRIVAANTVEEANALRAISDGNMFDRIPLDNKSMRLKCSDFVGAGKTRGWWAMFILNDTARTYDTANAAFVCGNRSFESALRAGYERAMQGAKQKVFTIDIVAGIAASPDPAHPELKGIQSPVASYAWRCRLSPKTIVDNAGHTRENFNAVDNFPSPPIAPNAASAGASLKAACRDSKFAMVPGDLTGKPLPTFP
jgi:hypothetical protein